MGRSEISLQLRVDPLTSLEAQTQADHARVTFQIAQEDVPGGTDAAQHGARELDSSPNIDFNEAPSEVGPTDGDDAARSNILPFQSTSTPIILPSQPVKGTSDAMYTPYSHRPEERPPEESKTEPESTAVIEAGAQAPAGSPQGKGAPNGTSPYAPVVRRAQELAASVQGLAQQLDKSDAANAAMTNRLRGLEEANRRLEETAQKHATLTQALQELPFAAMSQEQLQALQGMVAALRKDPDRISNVFGLVQQSEQLEHVVSSYVEMSRIVKGL